MLDSCRADERREQAEKPEDGDGDVGDSAGRRSHWDEHYESMDREREGAHPSEEVRELRCPAKKVKRGRKVKESDVRSLTGEILHQPDETHLDQSCLHLTETALVDASFVVPVEVEDVGSTENEVGREC